eukprot:scaffold7452_cov95-Isochrysis_galbana.AAC.6
MHTRPRRPCRLDQPHVLPAARHRPRAEQVVRQQQLVQRALLHGRNHVSVAVRDPVWLRGHEREEGGEHGDLGRRLGVGHAGQGGRVR